MFTRRGPRAPALQAVQAAIVAAAMRGVYSVGQRWTKWSEEWYWKRLVDKKKMFVSIYEDEPRSQRPLISKRSRNLSQTPREQCELEGHVREGLERPGPGQEVVLHGLIGSAELNGRRGRVLPSSGPGAPKTSCPAGCVAVRLAQDGKEVAVQPENLRSPHAAAAATAEEGAPAAAAPSGASVPPRPAQQQQRQQGGSSMRKAEMLRLLEVEFSQWQTGACLTPANLRRGGVRERHIRCCQCARDGQQVERYVALKRTLPLSATPLPDSALRLLCLDCYAETALALGLPLTEDAVEEWAEFTMMGAMEACMQLLGTACAQWGGSMGSGAWY